MWTSQYTVCHTISPDPPAAPGTPSVSFPILSQQFNISWDKPPLNLCESVDAYFVNISGPDDRCGSVYTPLRVTEHSYMCSGWTVPNGKKYTFTVAAANCDGSQRGPDSDPTTVFLQGMLRYTVFFILTLYPEMHAQKSISWFQDKLPKNGDFVEC